MTYLQYVRKEPAYSRCGRGDLLAVGKEKEEDLLAVGKEEEGDLLAVGEAGGRGSIWSR